MKDIQIVAAQDLAHGNSSLKSKGRIYLQKPEQRLFAKVASKVALLVEISAS